MSEISAQSLLNQMQRLATQAQGAEESLPPAPGQGFGDVFKAMVDSVNQAKQDSRELATAFETGDPRVSLPQVMVAAQKSRVYFEASLQARNKLLSAYKELMSMPL